MAKLNRQLRELLKDELVDEALQAKMVAALKAHTLAKLAWVPARGQRPHTLLTPYGALTVWPYFRGCWTVNRNSIPLVWQKDPRKEAVLNSLAAAQAAGLIHLRDDFGGSASENTSLRWDLDCPSVKHVASQHADEASLPDDHEWGERELDRRLLECPDTLAADVHIIGSIERRAERWQLPMPSWTRRARGWYELSSPYGALVVRRLIGWTVERNNQQIRWCCFGDRVIFDKLEHAKMSALVHAYDVGLPLYLDGTKWSDGTEEPPIRLSKRPSAISPIGSDCCAPSK